MELSAPELSLELETDHVGQRRAHTSPGAITSPRGAWAGQTLSHHTFTAARPTLPASADLLRLRRWGPWPFRPMGWRMDGNRTHPTLPSLGNVGSGFRPRSSSWESALVFAMALWPLARRQWNAARL